MVEWIWACFYFVSAYLLFLAIRNLPKLLILSWKSPFNALKVILYLAFSIFIFVSVHALSSFYSSANKQAVLEVHIDKLDHQYYQVSLVTPSKSLLQEKQTYLVYGDMWQVDYKVLTWHKIVSYFGIDTLYSLERLNGRYSDVDDEQKKQRSLYSLKPESVNDVAWPYALTILEISLVRGFYGTSVFAPLSNQAKYSVYLTETGIELIAINEAARIALKRWK